jgi:chromosome segregation ATPase
MYASNYSKNLITAEEKVAELMKQRDAAVAERDRLRAEVEELKGRLESSMDHHLKYRDNLREDLASTSARAELAEAAICKEMNERNIAVSERIEQQTRAERAEAELTHLRAEVRQARKAWLGGDYDHLPLIEAMEKFRNDRENEFDAAKADCERLQHLDSLLGQAAADVTAHTVTAGELAYLRAEVERLNAQVALDDKAKLLLVRCNTSDRLRAEKADARIKELENGIEKLYLELRNGKKPINL